MLTYYISDSILNMQNIRGFIFADPIISGLAVLIPYINLKENMKNMMRTYLRSLMMIS